MTCLGPTAPNTAGWCNGSTLDSASEDFGSIPDPATSELLRREQLEKALSKNRIQKYFGLDAVT